MKTFWEKLSPNDRHWNFRTTPWGIPKDAPDYTEEWIEALLSGKFKQGRLKLYHPDLDSYCCLGVAKKVANEISGKTPEVLDSFYLKEKDSYFVDQGTQEILVTLNDHYKFTFQEIARVIPLVLRGYDARPKR